MPVQICTEAQPVTNSLFQKTVTQSQRSGYDQIREQPSWSEYTCNHDEGNLPWRWTVPDVYKSLGASNSHHVLSRHIMSISGHANEQSISSYNSSIFKTVEELLQHPLKCSEANSAVVPVTPASISNGSRAIAFPNSFFFHGCTIQNLNMYVLPQSHNNPA